MHAEKTTRKSGDLASISLRPVSKFQVRDGGHATQSLREIIARRMSGAAGGTGLTDRGCSMAIFRANIVRMIEKVNRWAAYFGFTMALTLPLVSRAQSKVTLIEPADSPYLQIYSPCRERPPEHTLAREYFEVLNGPESADLEPLQSLTGQLRAIPPEKISALDAELYLVLVDRMDYLLDKQRRDLEMRLRHEPVSKTGLAFLKGARGMASGIAKRFEQDVFVRCAWLGIRKDREARLELVALQEDALRGTVQIAMPAYRIHYRFGQMYLDRGFKLLPHTEKAGEQFELGARHLLDAATDATDRRYADNWKRYSFMLGKLPAEQRLAISRRLLTYLESTRKLDSQASAPALGVYLYVLDDAADAALASKERQSVVSIYEKYLSAARQLRALDPQAANSQVNEISGELLLGDALSEAGDRPDAVQHYREAERLLRSASSEAVEILEFQSLPETLKNRLERLQ